MNCLRSQGRGPQYPGIVMRPIPRVPACEPLCAALWVRKYPESLFRKWGAVLELCAVMLTNCKSVAEQLIDCTSVYKEASKDFSDNF